MRNLRRVLSAILLIALCLGLAACGASKDNTPDASAQTPAETPAVVETPEEAEPDSPKNTDSPADGQVPDSAVPATAEDLKAIAEKFIDRPVEELYDAIGEPESADYAPSCLVPNEAGEDGELLYDGFTVYTYRANGVETVNGVR